MSIPTEIKVWDLGVRLFHWLLVTGFFFAYFAEGGWLIYHVWAGYGVLTLLCFRLVWGFIGPRYARFSDFVRGPVEVLRYLAAVLRLRAKRHLGHNPAGGAMIVALIACVMLTTWSGILLYGADAWLGPMAWLMQNADEDGIAALETVHGFLAHLTVLLVAIHVGGVIWESVLHGENLAKTMISGRKQVRTERSTASARSTALSGVPGRNTAPAAGGDAGID